MRAQFTAAAETRWDESEKINPDQYVHDAEETARFCCANVLRCGWRDLLGAPSGV